ncbi:KRAB-A domain-containing protein 2 [Trichonephila clavipes]|nr:KRAB-A domain-containing protein 2 [Trichonephila clavipes]
MEVGNEKSLILKRKFDSDPFVKIVSTESFYHILRETHQLTGHGGRVKMIIKASPLGMLPWSSSNRPKSVVKIRPIVTRLNSDSYRISTAFSDSSPDPSNPRLLNFNYIHSGTLKIATQEESIGLK